MKNSMLLLLFGTVLVAVANAAISTDPKFEQWADFKLQYNKRYESKGEELRRMNVFFDQLRRIQERNAEYEQGLSTYTLGVNQFADWTHQEFLLAMSGGKGIQSNKLNAEPGQIYEEFKSQDKFDEYLNWDEPENNPRNVDAVGEMQDQLRDKCASGWAFAATAAIEGAIVLQLNKTKPIYNLSEQQFIDCASKQGCVYDANKPNTPKVAFNYMLDDNSKHGIEEESNYNYTAEQGACVEDSSKYLAGVKLSSINRVPESELALQQTLHHVGPAAVMIDITDPDFMSYKTGIYEYKNWDNDNKQLTHGATVIGYGIDKATNIYYWILKNSYGENWGENGYMKLVRNKKNQLGIASDASTPMLAL